MEDNSSNLVHLTKDNFDSEIKNGLVFIDFWADWCTPCKIIAPLFEKQAAAWKGKIKFAKLNVDEFPEIAAKYNVMSIPFLIMFNNGEIKDSIIGAMPENVFQSFLEKNYQDSLSTTA